MKFEFKIDPITATAKLKNNIKNKCIRIALNAAAAPVKQSVIANAPSARGYLKKAIRIKLKNYKNNSAWLVVIGASSTFTRGGKKRKIRPAKYSNLVEKGTKFMTAKPYLKPAYTQTKSQFANVFFQRLQQEISKNLTI